MSSSWPRTLSQAGLTAAVLLASPFSLAAESPATTAALEGVDVATGHLFNALIYLPTGFVAAALFLEFFAHWKKNRDVEPGILFLLFGAAGAAVASAALAYTASPVGQSAGEVQQYAMWMGVVAAAISAAFYLKRQARNRKLFSLKPVPALSGKIALPRTSGQRGLLIGYRLALVISLLITLVGVSEMPLSHARTRSLASSIRNVTENWGKPAPVVAVTAAAPAESGLAQPPPAPDGPPAPAVPSLAHLLGNESVTSHPPTNTSPGSQTAPTPESPTPPPDTAVTTPPEPEPATTPPELSAPATSTTTSTPTPPPPAPSTGGGSPAQAGTAARLPSNFFASKIKPVLDSKCVDCHGASKQKGDLRLDSIAAIKHGAGHPVVVAGDLELSTLYQRLITPDDEDLMPPPDKGGRLPPNIIALFKSWIQAGADFGDGATPAGRAPAVTARPGGKLEEEKSQSLTAPSPDVLNRLTEGGAVIRPLSANGALLDINLTHFEAGPVNLGDLSPIAKNIMALDLSRTRIKDADLAPLADMIHLVRLELKRNTITDAGLIHLKGLAELESLNLFDTQVTDQGMQHLTGLKRLQKIFLFNTKVTPAGADTLRKAIPGLVVNLGE